MFDRFLKYSGLKIFGFPFLVQVLKSMDYWFMGDWIIGLPY